MKLPTFNKNLGEMIKVSSFLFGVLLIPTSGIAFNNNMDFKYLNEETCEETLQLLSTPGDSYSTLGIEDLDCLGNATTPTDGQFIANIVIEGEPNTIWWVDDAIGYYDPNFPAPGFAPTPLMIGEGGVTFTEYNIDVDSSVYKLEVLTVHGESNLIRMRSNKDDIVTLVGRSPKYEYSLIEGPISLCTETSGNYYSNTFPGPFVWTLPMEAGEIVYDDKNGNITVDWGAVPGTYPLMFHAEGNDCVAPTILQVTIGEQIHSAIACESGVNVSLPSDCVLVIEPEVLIVGETNPGAPYAVMLTDEHDHLIPGAKLTYEHVGKTVKAKVLDGCSGNSCWSWLTVEDKMPPIIIDDDVTIACYQTDEYDGPLAIDNCTHIVEPILIHEEVEAQDCDDEEFSYIISRTYIAIDDAGNVSEEYDIDIYVERVELDSIKFPANLMRVDGTHLTCNNYDLDENGFPDPEITGIPTLGGEPIWPSANRYCNLFSSYSDKLRKPDDCTKKVMRTWTIYEWYCEGVIDTQFTQVIEIADIDPPVLECPEDYTISASIGDCEGTFQIPPVIAEDECSEPENLVVDIAYPGGFLPGQNGGIVKLPFGLNKITYYVYDECGNLDSCSINVEVVDKSPPVAICDQNSVVSLDVHGDGYAPASVFDDGSYDACKIDYMEVRRMDLGAPCHEPDEQFGPYVEFCCADAGKIVVVELKVWDKAMNSNSCMVNVEVQDKFSPEITAPVDMTINCGDEYDLNDLSEYGSPEVRDACDVTVNEDSFEEIDQCNVGKITRIFIASDANGSSVDTQCIYIVNPYPFNGDIDWPDDVDTSAVCGEGDVDPEDLPEGHDYPVYEEGICDLVAATYKDEIYPFDDPLGNACFKVIRTWTVIDWCQPVDPRPEIEPGYDDPRVKSWYWTQVIKISNLVPPTVDGSLDDLEVCSDNCEGGEITLEQTGSDDCTPLANLQWEWEIDLYDDDVIDTMDTGHGPNMEASDFYPIGVHTILWTYEDLCGNKVSKEQYFTIKDCNGPKAVGIDGFAIGLTGMDLTGPNGEPDGEPDTEMACMWAYELDASSYHPCDIPISFSFSLDTTDQEICFDCFDLGLNEVALYVTDIFGNVDSVFVTIDVQDNNDVDICMDPRDCVTFPVDTMITDCIVDLDPVTLSSEPFIDPNCLCLDYDITFEDDTLNTYPDANCLFVRRNWTVTFNCGRNPIVTDQDQEIRVLNILAPDLAIPGDVTVAATGDDCMGDVMLDAAVSESVCNSGVVITNSYNGGGPDASGLYPVGETEVIFTVMDACGNENTDTLKVTVTDGELPTCVPMDITITLDENGDATIVADDVDGGSSDNCGMIDSKIISKSEFDCGDLGQNTVTLTVTDDSDNMSECDATVTVRDTLAPMCIPQDITIQVDDQGDTNITPDMVDGGSTDPCGMITDKSLDRTAFNCTDTGMGTIVTLTLTDNSGNTSECDATVTVEDNIPPSCTIQDITVSLEGNNMIVIDAIDLMIVASDDCGIVVDTTLSEDTFDCGDLGANAVTVTVTDNSGNQSAQCQATVTVEDMTEPVCEAKDITIQLDEMGVASITVDSIDNGSAAGCDMMFSLELDRMDFSCLDIANNPTVVTLTITDNNTQQSKNCTANVTVEDNIDPMVECRSQEIFCYEFDGDLASIGGLIVSDNCMGSITDIDTMILVDGTNTCGIGTVTRRFIVTDAEGNTNSCDQVIDILPEVVPFDEGDITWPDPMVLVEDCTAPTGPGDIGSFPTTDESLDSCSLIVIDFMDSVTSSGAFCGDTIERKWTVVDSCQFDGITMAGMWMFTQTIVVADTAAPVIQGPPDFTVTAPDAGVDCEIMVDLSGVMVTDDCDDNVVVTNDSPMADSNDTGDASGTYVPGIYDITITAVDKCGNMSTYTYTLTVEEPDSPGLPCIKVFAVIQDNELAEVIIADFGVLVATECYDPTNFVFSFDRVDMNVSSVIFDCDDVGVSNDPEGLGLLTPLYAFVDGILVDSCENIVTVIDPFDNCSFNLTEVEGKVFTSSGDRVEGVQIQVTGDMNRNILTNEKGEYAFPSLDYGTSVTLEPFKNDDVLNGVSTLDLLFIQRHVLGLDEIEDVHMKVAADINNNKGISIVDVLELRKVLLGFNDQFPTNNSWRMIESNYAFPEKDNPFAEDLPERYAIKYLDRRMNIDWVGVKVGDVDGSAKANSRSRGSSRSANEDFALTRRIENGNTILSVDENNDIFGIQMALKIANDEVVLNSDLPGFDDDNYRVDSDGILRISWNSDVAIGVSSNTRILELVQNSVESMAYNETLLPEIYMNNEGEIFVRDLIIEDFEIRPIAVTNNHPNPWVEYTDVGFRISYNDKVTVNLYSSNGRLIKSRVIEAVKGDNNTRFYSDELDASGVIFYDVISSKEKVQGKMILIK